MESRIRKLIDEAIDAAVSNNWDKAIDLNNHILKIAPHNIDAHLGLGFAYLQTNQLDKAIRHYRKAISIEPGNLIARNNLDKLAILKKKTIKKDSEPDLSTNLKEFINIIGKTKVVELVNIGQSETLVHLKVGERVEIRAKKRRVEIRTAKGSYIGALPDDISKRLLFFIEAGSTYNVYIKSALKNQVEVFLNENKKGAKVRHFVSFPKNIQDDLKGMMQQLQKDDDENNKLDKDDDEDHGGEKDQNIHDDDGEEEAEITDLDALAADIDDEPHDTFITDLSAYNEGEDDAEE